MDPHACDPLSSTSILQPCPAGCDGGAQPRLDRSGPGRPCIVLGACGRCAGWGWIPREAGDIGDVMDRTFRAERDRRAGDERPRRSR